jgi:hypothetical protein
LLRQAANTSKVPTQAFHQPEDLELGMMLPGIKINAGPNDFAPVKQMQMARFNGASWELFGPVMIDEAVASGSNTPSLWKGNDWHGHLPPPSPSLPAARIQHKLGHIKFIWHIRKTACNSFAANQLHFKNDASLLPRHPLVVVLTAFRGPI